VFGGATGLIGDPSGRSSERSQMSAEQINSNVESLTNQFKVLEDNFLNSADFNTFLSSHSQTPSDLETSIYA
jgi:tyrosyl-tRNA synthetase